MKGLKFASLAMASLMALSLVGCGPQEDPKVRFLRECKQSLSADECQQLAYNKSQEEQARIMKSGTYNTYANQPGGYNTSGYANPSQPQYQQQGYVQHPQQPGYAQQNNGFVDTATGAVVGLAAGAAIGHAIGSSNNNRNVNVDNSYAQRQEQARIDKDRAYQQQVRDANQYRQQSVPAYTDTNKVTRFAAPSTPSSAPSAPAAPVRQSVFNKPAAAPVQTAYKAPAPVSRPSAPASKPSSSYTPRASVFKK